MQSSHVVSRIIPYAFLTILSVLIYLSAGLFRTGYFDWIDLGFPLDVNYYHTFLYTWIDHTGVGNPTGWLGELPYDLAILGLSKMGLPFWVVDKIAYVFPVALRGYSMYYLVQVILQKRNWPAVAAGLAAAELFMYIPVDAYNNVRIGLFLAAIPLIISLYLRGIQTGYGNRSVVLVALASTLGFIFPLSIAFTAFMIVVYSIHHWLTVRDERRRYLTYLSKTSVLAFLVNAFVILPAIDSYGYLINALDIERTVVYSPSLLTSIAPYFTFDYVMRLIHGAYSAISYFSMPIVVGAGFAIAIMSWSSLLLSKNRFLPTLAITAIVSTALSTGVEYPGIKTVYLAGYYSVLNVVFQTQYYFVYLLGFAYACMLGIGTYAILSHSKGNHHIERFGKFMFLMLLCTSAALYALPLYNNTWYDNSATPHPLGTPEIANGYAFHGTNFQIPLAYNDLRSYLGRNATVDDRLLVAPVMDNYYQFSWSGNNTLTSIIPYYSPIPVLGVDFTFPQIITDAESLLDNGSIASAIPVLQALSARYVLVPGDIPAMFSRASEVTASLSSSHFFTSTDFGSFTIFRLDNVFKTAPVFALTSGSLESEIPQNNPSQIGTSSSIQLPNAEIPLSFGLVGYWPLQQTTGDVVPDATNNGNDGVLHNSPAWESGLSCKYADCLSFQSGASQFASIVDSPSLHVSAFTVSLWVFHNGTMCQGNQGIISKGAYNEKSGWTINLNANTPCDFMATIGGIRFSTSSCARTACPVSGWNNLVLTYDGVTAKFYINGILRASGAASLESDTSDIWFAREPVAFSFANIRLEGIRVYNYALPQLYVSELDRYSFDNSTVTSTTIAKSLDLNFTRLSPTDYTVRVNAKEPFVLVLDEAFSSGWVASVNGSSVATDHYTINTYANAWVINRTGELGINLNFETQGIVLPSFLVSALAVSGILIFLALELRPDLARTTRARLRRILRP